MTQFGTGLRTAEDVRQYWNSTYRHPKALNVFTIPHAILGVDGAVLAIRNYPPSKPKDASRSIVAIPGGLKVCVGWVYKNGKFDIPCE